MRALVLVLAGCFETASSDPGTGDLLHVDGAQYRPGAFPAASGGPSVASARTTHATIAIGEDRERLAAVLAPEARAAIVGVVGARGSWIVPAGPADLDTPGQPSVHATFGLGPALPPGPFELDIAAVDGDERIGEAMPLALVAADAAPPDGALVVTLEWTSTADLDLHVIEPTGGEAWQGHPTTWQQPPPGTPGIDPCAWAASGILDHDANASCTQSGTPNEHVIWTTRSCAGMDIEPALPPGEYIVRVEPRSLCKDASAAWLVSVFHQGALVGMARGIATPWDVDYGPHGPGAGVTALRFSL